ncbi:MAG TPA: hypothetical protein DET40_13245 [Lentisphaeria bacterium]|nr:hypothetical protein [Lentisphaeria bacterium]
MKTKLLVFMFLAAALLCGSVSAIETENNGIRILPAGKVVVDGKYDDWDLSGGIFTCSGVETNRDIYSVWVHMMYDKDFLYVLARWNDPTPANNPGSTKGDHGFNGDCLQIRFITGYEKPGEKVSHWTCWRDREGLDVMDIAYGRDFNGGSVRNAKEKGAMQAFQMNADQKGYVQEIAIPWKLITADGNPLKAGDNMVMAVEPNFTAGLAGRITIKDIFRSGIVPDRVFTFRAYKHWGTGTLESKGKAELAPVRLSDDRYFPVVMKDGNLTVDWTGLIVSQLWPGFKKIEFDMPFDGYVSMNLIGSDGVVARQLLTENYFQKGKQAADWDGLSSPSHRQPGTVVPAGKYTWKAIATKGFGVTLRGWASHSGKAPWTNGPTDDWGGDHGVPSACVFDGTRIIMAWNGAEGGKHVQSTDLQGVVQWGLKNTTGAGDPNVIAADGGTVYILNAYYADIPPVMTRADSSNGTYSWWKGRDSTVMPIKETWEKPEGMPDHFDGLDAKNGKLYATCSDPRIRTADVVDMKAFLTKMQAGGGVLGGIVNSLSERTRKSISEWLAGQQDKEPKPKRADNKDPLDTVVGKLNEMIAKEATGAAAQAKRKEVDAALGGSIRNLNTNLFVILDGSTGKVVRTWPLECGSFVRAVNDNLVYVLAGGIASQGDTAGGSSVVSIDPATGKVTPFIQGLKNARSLALDKNGKMYVGVAEPDQQVLVFSKEGKQISSIGRKGGRPAVGAYEPSGMYKPFGVAVDNEGKLWVMESNFHPKRVSVWNTDTGALVKEFFGMTHYGASGASINPQDPNVVFGEGCEWRIDPATGFAKCTGTVEQDLHGFAAFREGADKKLYLHLAKGEGYGPCDHLIYERIGEGKYVLRTAFLLIKDAESKPVGMHLWTDEDGSGKVDLSKAAKVDFVVMFTGSNHWSLNLGLDQTLYGYDPAKKRLLRLPLKGYSTCGAPKYDLAGAEVLPPQYAEGYQPNYSCAIPDATGKRLLTINMNTNEWQCFNLETNKILWTYPNPYFQVHGSHRAPTPVPGLTRGAFGPVGIANLPAPVGTLWAINGNLGEWYLLNGDGFYLGHLFQGDPTKFNWPEKAVPGADLSECPAGSGGEDFGGSLTQGKDGKVYIQAGKNAVWNTELKGIDSVKDIGSGQVELAQVELAKANEYREKALQSVTAGLQYSVAKFTAPSFSGNFDKDFPKIQRIEWKKGDSEVRALMSYDDNNLYIGWQVNDRTPWMNGAKEFVQMYSEGDTVDFQFGSNQKADSKRADAAAGDFRISIGNLQGKPVAVLYRKQSDVKKSRSFTSGVVANYTMDYVDVIPDAKIEVKIENGKGYVVEAAIPFSALGFKPQPDTGYKGDLGATFGDPAGQRTRLRAYWNNQQTGLVDDVVFELQMVPKNWATIVFQ